MKTFALLAFLFVAAIAQADDNLLRNGDFSEGITHWEGDCHTADNEAVDGADVANPSSGIMVKLRSGDWTKVMQDFDGKVGQYTVTITYSISSDLKFSDRAEDYVNVPGKLEFSRLSAFTSLPGKWVLIVNDLGAMRYHYWEITPNMGTGIQKVTAEVTLRSDDTDKKGFYLLFPPGSGYISLQSITMTPKTVAAAQ